MSDAVDDFQKKLEQDVELEKKKKEIQVRRVNNEYGKIKELEKATELANSSSFGALRPEHIKRLAKENREYLEAAVAAGSMKFISDSFDGIVPFFEKNLILIGAPTGSGKTTCVSNIVRSTISQINPITGKGRRALVISNEETAPDVYNRLTSMSKGWHYVNHDKFTPDQIETFEKYIAILAGGGRLTVIDDAFEFEPGITIEGLTTTPEGIETIFKNMMRDGDIYDVVLIDYYQGIVSSTSDHHMDEFKAQRKLVHVLDKYRKIYPAPIVLMCQVNPQEKDKKVPFQHRIQGTKLISNKATMSIEMIIDRDNLTTEWLIHKGRFAESTGQSVLTGFDKGKFVKYNDPTFQKTLNEIKKNRAEEGVFDGIDKDLKK